MGERDGEAPAERDMEVLNDWSTSIGSSESVPVGERNGDEDRVEGKDSMHGEEESESMMPTRRSCAVGR